MVGCSQEICLFARLTFLLPLCAKSPCSTCTASTRDDRVRPGHARKMVRKLLDMGKGSTYYYENIEGGHGGAADNKQRAFMTTLAFNFLEQVLGSGTVANPTQQKA